LSLLVFVIGSAKRLLVWFGVWMLLANGLEVRF
jgi:hypothetical protein